jgi:hypothetical protein
MVAAVVAAGAVGAAAVVAAVTAAAVAAVSAAADVGAFAVAAASVFAVETVQSQSQIRSAMFITAVAVFKYTKTSCWSRRRILGRPPSSSHSPLPGSAAARVVHRRVQGRQPMLGLS